MNTWSSILPPALTLVAVLVTRRVIISLAAGVLAGSWLLAGGLVAGLEKAGEFILSSLTEANNAVIILFLFLFGSLTEMMSLSGGIKGFTGLMDRYVRGNRAAQLSVWYLTPLTFIDCCFHAIATGTVAKPILEREGGSKTRLAMTVTITSSQLVALVPVATTYVGYVVALVAGALQQIGSSASSFGLYLHSLPFNFFSILMVLTALGLLWPGFGPKKEKATGEKIGGKHPHVVPEKGVHEKEEAEHQRSEPVLRPNPLNLIVPLGFLLAATALFLARTGSGKGPGLMSILLNADFERSIFLAALLTVAVAGLFYLAQGIGPGNLEKALLHGGMELLPPIVILVLAWSLSRVTEGLGFSKLVAAGTAGGLPAALLPVLVFLLGAGVSYVIGSSWATWGLLMPAALSLGKAVAIGGGLGEALLVGAVLAGGSVGDCASPLGETPMLSASLMELNLAGHIRSILPYAIGAVSLAATLYLVFGCVWLR